MKKVMVVYGGLSNEKDVSKSTGAEVIKALESLNIYQVLGYELTHDIAAFVQILNREKPDAVFNALHGTYGEDGHIQALLNLMKIPYTHSGLQASAIAFDKPLTNKIYAQAGLPIAKSEVMYGRDIAALFPFNRDVVIKPACDGSSVGVYIVKKGTNSIGKDFENWHDELMMVEDYISGRELTVSVDKGKMVCITEIVTKHQFYDYSAKYEVGGSKHILPAQLSKQENEQVKSYAEQAYNLLKCRGIARVDFRYDGHEFYILEINTQPGMTPTSLTPEQMAYQGISYPEMCKQLIEEASTD